MTEPGGVNYLEAWRAKRSTAPEVGMVAPATRPSGREAYGAAILDGEVERVRTATQGQRNATLNVAAVKCGRAIAGGHMDEDAARAALMNASLSIGLTRTEATKTIKSGFRYGMQHPRDADATPRPLNLDAPEPTDITDALPPAPPVEPVPVVVEKPKPNIEGYLRPGSFLLDLPANPPAVWGDGEQVLWAQGEALMVAALPGLGKTTIAGQLVRARMGLDSKVLDLDVLPGKRVLYLCMDRPQQIGRSLLRSFSRDELEQYASPGGRLVLGWGPPPADVARNPELLADLCASAGADTLVVDSLKDAAMGLTDDEVGAGYNRARQLAITAGVEVLELHHLVKRGADGRPPSSLADVYGSAWLTAGAGSVIVLVGEPGDPIVKAHHLKQPREPWGPQWLAHDHPAGRTTVHNRVDLLELLAMTQVQTAASTARALYETETPSRAQAEKARRLLEGLVRKGLAYTTPGKPGGGEGSSATKYHPLTRPVSAFDEPEEGER